MYTRIASVLRVSFLRNLCRHEEAVVRVPFVPIVAVFRETLKPYRQPSVVAVLDLVSVTYQCTKVSSRQQASDRRA